jgi:hypothetical protein
MEKEKLKKGFYLIKADTKDYSLTEEKKKEIDDLDCKEEHKDFFKKLFNEPTPKTDDLLVELVGENPFLKIKSVKNVVTGVDITNKYLKEVDDVNPLITFTNHLEWIPQNT